MANYGILRVEKIKTAGGLMASLEHCTRERTTLNADPERTAQNGIFGPSGLIKNDVRDKAAILFAIHKELIAPLRKRKDSVLALGKRYHHPVGALW